MVNVAAARDSRAVQRGVGGGGRYGRETTDASAQRTGATNDGATARQTSGNASRGAGPNRTHPVMPSVMTVTVYAAATAAAADSEHNHDATGGPEGEDPRCRVAVVAGRACPTPRARTGRLDRHRQQLGPTTFRPPPAAAADVAVLAVAAAIAAATAAAPELRPPPP